jgi:hypothetical protein
VSRILAEYTLEELEAFRAVNNYLAIKRLDDGSIAVLMELVFTRAILLGVEEVVAFRQRFCFENRAWASREFDLLKTEHDEPEGWTATRPKR